jgi:hypothetical protein|eukprot:COSAG01_NODE_2542_length_7472_cov_25.428455_6_plen_32_part_00
MTWQVTSIIFGFDEWNEKQVRLAYGLWYVNF